MVVICTLFIISCTTENVERLGSDSNGVKMSAKNFLGELNTRISLTPEKEGTSFAWDTGDVVSVYSSTRGLTNFFIDPSSISDDGTSAYFNGSGFSLSPNANYYAFYPYSSSALDKSNIPVSYYGQNISTNGNFKELGLYDYMYATGITNDEGHVDFNFEHLGCVVDCELTVPETAYYTQLRLELSDGHSQTDFIKTGHFDFTTPIPRFIGNESEDTIMSVSLNKEEGIMVKKDSTLHIYMMLAPQNLSGKNITIRLIDADRNWYTASVSGKDMKAGHTYHYYVDGNSPIGGFTGKGNGFPNEFCYSKVSCLTSPTKTSYEDVIVDGNMVYAVGQFGIRKIDYSNENDPCVVAERKYENLRYRSIADGGEFLYISMRQSSQGMIGVPTPDIQLTFDTNMNSFPEQLSDNQIVNDFFSRLSLVSCNVSDITMAYLYKAVKKQEGVYRNTISFKCSDGKTVTLFGENYTTREEALASLKSFYRNTKGDECEVDWTKLPEGANNIKNTLFYNRGMFDAYYHTGTASISETGDPCPNTGRYSAKCWTLDNAGHDSAVLARRLKSSYENGELSFWIKTSCSVNNNIDMPLLSYGDNIVLSLSLIPEGTGYKVNVSSNNMEYQSEAHIDDNVWYNIKLHLTPSKVKMFMRTKECGEWIGVLDEEFVIGEFNTLNVGISTKASHALVFMDDFYFHQGNIDDVTYVNGSLLIVDKKDLSLVNTYHLDLISTEIAVHDKVMVLNMLKGFNVYDITDVRNPILRYAYRYPSNTITECQGVDFFEKENKLYAFICNYSLGYTIVDLTDLEKIEVVARNDDPVFYGDASLKGCSYNFDVVVDYPYAYMTHCTSGPYIGTDMDYRGIVIVNLSDFSNLTQSFAIANEEDYYDKTTGDHCPIYIEKSGTNIFIDNGKGGVMLFDASEKGNPSYVGLIMNENESNVGKIKSTKDGRLFVTDNGTPYNLNMYRIQGQ